MNFIINIISKIIIILNRLIDSLDKKTVDLIRNSFYGLFVILAIVGIVMGYRSGKGAAKKYGKPLNETTNNVFDSWMRKGPDKFQFRSMIETEMIEEKKDTPLRKVDLPANEKIIPELDSKLIEPGSGIKRDSSPSLDNQKMADVDKTDEKLKKPDVRELKKDMPKIMVKEKIKKERESRPIDSGSKVLEK